MTEDIKKLSRMSIVQSIDINTPIIVLKEIALCHNLNFSFDNITDTLINEFTDLVYNNPIGNIKKPYSNYDWNIIARYVNPTEDWHLQDLERAYNHLKNWETSQYIPSYFDYGLQTSRNIFKINACVLYRICKYYNVPLNQNLTITNLAGICKILQSGSTYGISLIYNNLTKFTKTNMISLYIDSLKYNTIPDFDYPTENNSDLPEETTVYDYIPECISQFNNKTFLRTRISPKTKTEAIVLSAMNYRIDISLSSNPIKEYHILQRDPDNYLPNDTNLRVLTILNPLLLNLDEYFNPALPAELYTDDTLINMAKLEGYTNEDIQRESAYTLLQMTCYSNTFYHGKQPGIVNEQTPFYYDNVSSLDSDLIVCYGIKSITSMTAFTYKELAELFRNNQNFINPLNKELFSTTSIKKLKNLTTIIRTNQSKQSIEDCSDLCTAIINTELFTKESFNKAKDLYIIFSSASSELKQQIQNCIWALFKLSMYMRGWSGENNIYPIESAPVDNQLQVDMLVTQGMADFEEKCQLLQDVGNIILDLPLLIYQSGEFIALSNTNGGKTIKERLDIVKMGDSYTEYDSCIRLSSNLLATSSYKYMQILNMELPFKIDLLREIS
jgi:hypothetical protein